MKFATKVNDLLVFKKALCIALVLISSYANGQIRSLLTNKWKIDVERMRPVVEEMLNTREDMKYLDDSSKKTAIDQALNQISIGEIEYKKDGTYMSTTSKGKKKGKWELNIDSNTIKVAFEDEEVTYKLVSLTENKLDLITNKGLKLYFTSAKSR